MVPCHIDTPPPISRNQYCSGGEYMTTKVLKHSRCIGSCYGIGTVAVSVTASVRHELCIARGYLVQWRHGSQLVVRRLVVGFLRIHHGSLFTDAFLHLRDTHGVDGTLYGRVVSTQRQSSDTPIKIVRALALKIKKKSKSTKKTSLFKRTYTFLM